MRARMEVRGLRLDVRSPAARAESAGQRALARTGEFVRAGSLALVPRKSGRLAASARAEAGRVYYTAPYAAIQHERTEFHHPNGGRAHYLSAVAEDPATVRAAERILAQELRCGL